jgi:hypothetical protein
MQEDTGFDKWFDLDFHVRDRISEMQAFREFAEIGIRQGTDIIPRTEQHTYADHIQRNLPELASIIESPRFEEALHSRTNARADWAQSGTDAACLLFAHSIFEDCAQTLLEIVYVREPALFQTKWTDRSVPVHVALMGQVKIYEHLWLKERADIRRNRKLIENIRCLCKLCKEKNPHSYSLLREQYAFDDATLRVIDRTRQEIVHRPKPLRKIDLIDSWLLYLENGAEFLRILVAACFWDG